MLDLRIKRIFLLSVKLTRLFEFLTNAKQRTRIFKRANAFTKGSDAKPWSYSFAPLQVHLLDLSGVKCA